MPDEEGKARPEEAKVYIGCKVVKAWPAPAPKQMGEHPEGTMGMAVQYEDGYTSWSPPEVFKRAYRPLTRSETALINGDYSS